MENTDLWIGAVAEAANTYVTATINFFIGTIGLTSDTTNSMKPSYGLVSNSIEYLKQFSGFLAFDSFQLQLLKIFLSILIATIFMIFCAWYVYGERITERFMDPAHKIEPRNNFKYYSPNL